MGKGKKKASDSVNQAANDEKQGCDVITQEYEQKSQEDESKKSEDEKNIYYGMWWTNVVLHPFRNNSRTTYKYYYMIKNVIAKYEEDQTMKLKSSILTDIESSRFSFDRMFGIVKSMKKDMDSFSENSVSEDSVSEKKSDPSYDKKLWLINFISENVIYVLGDAIREDLNDLIKKYINEKDKDKEKLYRAEITCLVNNLGSNCIKNIIDEVNELESDKN